MGKTNRYIIYILLCMLSFCSCRNENSELLHQAEAQIWQYPDSALLTLEQVYTPGKLKDSVQDKLKDKEIRKLQLNYDKSVMLHQNAELQKNWYLTILIGTIIVTTLGFLSIYGMKAYRKRKELYCQAVMQLQKQINALQTVIKDNEHLYQCQHEEAVAQIAILQKQKDSKELRIQQLETIFHAKGISVSATDAKALQVFLKIIQKEEYHSAEEKELLAHWTNITCKNFATRLNEEYPKLSDREREICYMATLDLSLETISRLLNLQPRSIERNLSRICEKVAIAKRGKEGFNEFIKKAKID